MQRIKAYLLYGLEKNLKKSKNAICFQLIKTNLVSLEFKYGMNMWTILKADAWCYVSNLDKENLLTQFSLPNQQSLALNVELELMTGKTLAFSTTVFLIII